MNRLILKPFLTRSLMAASFALLVATSAHAQIPAATTPAPVSETPAVSPSTAPALAPNFEDLSEALLPTVVNVSTTMKLTDAQMPQMPELPELPPGSPLEDLFKNFFDQYKNQQGQGGGKSMPTPKASALGSGFIIDADKGYIVTNNHVIKGADEIKVILHDDTTLDAKLIGTDEKTDVAVLQVKPSAQLKAIKFGDSDQAHVGSWVLAIGNPFGLGGTVTAGIVSARQRNINAGPYDDFIQTDASINRGNSGGPMFNMKGEVIGVNTAIFSPSGGSVGIGFAIPSNIVKNVVDQLIKYGKTKRGWLGVKIQDVTPDIAESLGLDHPRGALVSSVTEKGPAAKAGIEAGDVVLKFNNSAVAQTRFLPRLVAETEVGKSVPVTVWHKGAEKTVTVTLGQLETAEESGDLADKPKADTPDKPATPDTTNLKALGLSVSPLTDDLRDKNGISKTTAGVFVSDVDGDGVAAEKGMQPGDVILEADQTDVTTPEQLKAQVDDAVKKGRASVLLFVERKEDRRFVALKLKK